MTALQDVASAAIVYEKAIAKNMGIKLNFSEQDIVPGMSEANRKAANIQKSFYPFC